jgi:hypothetical protein
MQDELLHRGVHLKVAHESSLPHMRLDARQARGAIERVLDFSVAVLPGGGKLTIEAQQREINGAQYVELQIIGYSAYSSEIDEEEVFQPFLQVQKHKAGLSLARAPETVYRNRGQISFQNNNSRQVLFGLLLKTYSGR